MTVQSVTYQNALNYISCDNVNKAMVTSWKVTRKGQTKTYFVVILQDPIKFGWSTKTSAYVTDQKPKKEDVSASMFHTQDMSKKILRDSFGNIICAYDPSLEANLGFTIDKAEFEKVNSISSELITKLGEFLKAHLDESSSSASESPAAASSSSSSGGSPAAASSSSASESPAAASSSSVSESPAVASSSSSSGGTPAPDASSNAPKSRLKPFVSGLSNRVRVLGSLLASQVTCNRVGFLTSAAAIASFWFYLNGDNEIPATLTSL